MSGFYSRAMRGAAVILFALAILMPVISVIVALMTYAGANPAEFSPMATGGVPSNLWPLIVALTNGLSNAVWPFFGAALLWRWDEYVKSGAAKS